MPVDNVNNPWNNLNKDRGIVVNEVSEQVEAWTFDLQGTFCICSRVLTMFYINIWHHNSIQKRQKIEKHNKYHLKVESCQGY